jgi:uncharacterized membrane protein YgdD (TMEM256/DUF423 family)
VAAERIFLAIAGFAGALSVVGDAVAAHALAGEPQRAELAATAARYGLIHAAALLALALLIERAQRRFWLLAAGWLFVAGIALFCGSLDLVAAGAARGWVIFAPWGGSAFIAGWLALFVAAIRAQPSA